MYPIFEGSGGGGFIVGMEEKDVVLNAGFGGGFIYVESIKIMLEGIIKADGISPEKPEYMHLGSGSGGSI